MSYDDDDELEEIRRRVAEEVNSLTASQLRTFRHSRSSMESWIYKAANAIARIITAPLRWIADAIRGFLDGLFNW